MERMHNLEFQKIIQAAALNNAFSIGDFIDHFDVSKGTVSRWTRGKSLPHLDARPAIVEWLKEFLKEEKEKKEAAVGDYKMKIENIIRNDEQNQFCLDEISRLMDLDPEIDSKDGVILAVLSIVVHAYEVKHYPIGEEVANENKKAS